MFTTVATLVISPSHVADYAVQAFRKTPEIDSLVSATMDDLKRPEKLVNRYKVSNAKKIYKSAGVNEGYLFRHISRKNAKVLAALRNMPPTHRMICRVEIPRADNKKYKNIDVGVTSNGKLENESLMGCSIRETFEEARILITPADYSEELQLQRRRAIGMDDLPLSFSMRKVFCYIIVI